MPSQSYKCNIFFAGPAAFSGQIPNGWSETYYTFQPSLDAAVLAIKNLAISRAGLVAEPNTIIALRASELTGNRISRLIPPEAYTYFSVSAKADTSWQAALVRLYTAEGLSRSLMLRGIPDAIYNPMGVGEVADEATWKARLDQFINNDLVPGPWYLYGISKDLTAFPRLQILDITNAVPGTLDVFTAVAHDLNPGLLVHLYNSGITPPLGTVRVQTTPALNHFTIKGDLPPGWELPVTAYARRIQKDTWKISEGAFERITHRIVGRPFGEQRGKRRTVKR